MPADQDVTDSPTGWVASHIRTYVNSDGARGHDYYGNTTLLLTTRGKVSGKLRRTALIYGRDGERYIVVGSNGGADKHPLWYGNLTAEPNVTVQVGAEIFPAVARTATEEERPALWELMTGLFKMYAGYQKKTERQIPVVIIERAPSTAS
jgi:deazaflavin-dependent oxidoreductase (nitroreductase family)